MGRISKFTHKLNVLAKKHGKKNKCLKHHRVEFIHHGVYSLEGLGVCDPDGFSHLMRLIPRQELAIHQLSPLMIHSSPGWSSGSLKHLLVRKS